MRYDIRNNIDLSKVSRMSNRNSRSDVRTRKFVTFLDSFPQIAQCESQEKWLLKFDENTTKARHASGVIGRSLLNCKLILKVLIQRAQPLQSARSQFAKRQLCSATPRLNCSKVWPNAKLTPNDLPRRTS